MPNPFALPSVDDLLTEAWERLTLSPAVITADMAQSALRSLGALLVDWTNRGINLWQVDRQNTVATVGQTAMPCPAGTVDVLEVLVTVGGLELMLSAISRDEWAAIPNKTLMSRPTQYWSECTAAGVILHLWPAPDQAYPVAVNRLRMPYDTGTLSAAPDAPALWTEALYAGLAARLAAKFKPDLEDKRTAQAEAAYASASGENRERVPLTLLPALFCR